MDAKEQSISAIINQAVRRDHLAGFLRAMTNVVDLNVCNPETGQAPCHVAAQEQSARILSCLYGDIDDASRMLCEELNEAGQEDDYLALMDRMTIVREGFNRMVRDSNGRLSSELVPHVGREDGLGRYSRQLHAMLLGAELWQSQHNSNSLGLEYSITLE